MAGHPRTELPGTDTRRLPNPATWGILPRHFWGDSIRPLQFYERKRIILVENETTAGLAGQYVDIYAFADGRLEVRWKGMSLPFTVFDKDQRVTHAAIVENKRLGEVLAFIKVQQDQHQPSLYHESDTTT